MVDDPPREPGPIEAAVARELGSLSRLESPLALMALKLAYAMDEASVADVAELAKLNQELRQTLARLTTVNSDDEDTIRRLLEWAGTPS